MSWSTTRTASPATAEPVDGRCTTPRKALSTIWSGPSRLLGRGQGQRHRVDAVALVRRGRVALALEDVAQVGVAVRAADLDADHAEGGVLQQPYRVGLLRLVEARPAAVGVELGLRAEQLRTAGAAVVDA